MTAVEALILMRIAPTNRNADQIRDAVIHLPEKGVIFGFDQIGSVNLKQALTKGHIVVEVALLFEIIGAEDIVELLVKGIARQLKLLAELPLLQRKANSNMRIGALSASSPVLQSILR